MPHAIDSNQLPVAGLILAGGRGRRMEGTDKGLVTLDGRPLAGHVAAAIAPQVREIIVNCNRHRDRYTALGYRVISDTLPGGLGPLAGILSGFEASECEYLLTVPCDMPLLPPDLVERMAAKLLREGSPICSVHDGERLHAVITLASRDVVPGLRDFLLSGKRKVQDWLRTLPCAVADFSDEAPRFVNINTFEELNVLKKARR